MIDREKENENEKNVHFFVGDASPKITGTDRQAD
jgi:hypothetical protein